ncbi:MAG: flagellar biosynthesis anti-sigma factor FlgM [Planctomycetota bacterium]|jgi:negative regulator of flagellin synthesis FlgM
MHVHGPAHLHGAQPINPPHTSRVSRPVAPDHSGPIQDELEISDAAQLVDQIRELPEVRQERINQIRAQIADGTYETDEKLQIALGRMLDEIG